MVDIHAQGAGEWRQLIERLKPRLLRGVAVVAETLKSLPPILVLPLVAAAAWAATPVVLAPFEARPGQLFPDKPAPVAGDGTTNVPLTSRSAAPASPQADPVFVAPAGAMAGAAAAATAAGGATFYRPAAPPQKSVARIVPMEGGGYGYTGRSSASAAAPRQQAARPQAGNGYRPGGAPAFGAGFNRGGFRGGFGGFGHGGFHGGRR